jgi:D-sedoheptulose 7-phosphate isomerase
MIDTPIKTRSNLAAGTYLSRLSELLTMIAPGPLDEAIAVLLEARATGHRVYIMGNGGSAATSSHLANDLLKTSRVPGQPAIRAFALVDNPALLTAWANDMSYDRVFEEYLEAVVEPDDVVIAISASGNSTNVLRGVATAEAHAARTIGLMGFDGGALLEAVDVAIHIGSTDYGLIEDAHMAVGHALSHAIRLAAGPD